MTPGVKQLKLKLYFEFEYNLAYLIMSEHCFLMSQIEIAEKSTEEIIDEIKGQSHEASCAGADNSDVKGEDREDLSGGAGIQGAEGGIQPPQQGSVLSANDVLQQLEAQVESHL